MQIAHRLRGLSFTLIFCSGCEPELELQPQLRMAGNFSGLQLFEAEGTPWAAALATAGEIALSSLADGRGCSGEAIDRCFPANDPDGAAAVVTWTAGVGDCGALGFLDQNCQALMEPLPCVAVPRKVAAGVLGGRWRRHLVIEGEDQSLRLVNPWAAEVVELGSAVRKWRWADITSMWMLDHDRLVLRDLDGGADRQLGAAVNDVTFTPKGAAIYGDEGGVWLVRSAAAEPELLSASACSPSATLDGKKVAYLSPCAERRLVLHALDTGEVTPVADGVAAFRTNTSPLFFLTGADPEVGELYAYVGGAALPVASDASLASVRSVMHDGTTAYLALVGVDTPAPALVRFDGASTSTLIDHAVAFDVRHEHVAALIDEVAGLGTLVLLPEGGGPLASVATGVPRERFAFSAQLEALGWIGGFDGKRGRLELDALTSDDHRVLDEEASEFVEVISEAQPGVAYLVPTGERAGIWFATPQ
jgi:hypothetical protein